MKRFFDVPFILFLVTTPFLAMAEDAVVPQKAATPPPVSTTAINLTSQEIQVLAIALSNAGAACDNNVQIYCQLLPLRAPLINKLNDAVVKLNTPASKDAKKP